MNRASETEGMLTENSEVARKPGRVWPAGRMATNTIGGSPLAIRADAAIMEFGLPSTVAIESINLARELTGEVKQSVRAALLDEQRMSLHQGG